MQPFVAEAHVLHGFFSIFEGSSAPIRSFFEEAVRVWEVSVCLVGLFSILWVLKLHIADRSTHRL